jgi:4-hydroxybenzoate polyprenyltransferase
LVLFVMFLAYSHPRTRWKASTWGALATIFVGQGVIGFVLGWSTVADPSGLASPRAWLAMVATGIVVTGLYVVTQAYQAEEDGARGDRTLPVVWGPARAVRAATLALAPGGAALWWELLRVGGPAVGVASAAGFAVLAAWMFAWSLRIERTDVTANFRTAMRIWTTSGTALSITLAALLAAPLVR